MCVQNSVQMDLFSVITVKKWSHRQCYDMSDTDLKSWSPSYLKFVCQKCGFRNGKYDVEAALKRYVHMY